MAHAGIYEALGGTPGCRRLAEALYARIAGDRLLRPLFPGKTFRCAIEAFAAFLVQFLGGPAEDAEHRWWLSLDESHRRFAIGPRERDAWLLHMTAALEEMRIEAPVRAAFQDYFEHASAYLVNQGDGLTDITLPSDPELAARWRHQRAIDDIIAMVRAGDVVQAVQAVGRLDPAPSIHCGLLALMIAERQPLLLDYVHTTLRRSPELAHARYSGNTLLYTAAGAGDARTVELLLRLGADSKAVNGGCHTALYALANQCILRDGAPIVGLLVEAGADVNACGGVKRCTPLHMAARRGTAAIAAALLDCGADLEARDTLGETPLRRAVNCNQPRVAALLVSRGADVHSRSAKGITPMDAARSEAMRRALLSGSGGN
jgi:hemoglobin